MISDFGSRIAGFINFPSILMQNSGYIKIQAAVLREKGRPLKIETLEMEGPREDEVLVRIVASGVCRTDMHFCDEWFDGGPPLVLGHEGAGVVEEIGKKVKRVKPGDHVVLSFQSCGRCRACRRGRPAHCEHSSDLKFGFQRLDGTNALERSGVRGHFFGQSSFATHSLATERNLVKISKNLPLEKFAPLGCGIQTGAGTVMNTFKVPKGASIAVFGTGAVGLSSVMAVRLVGADPIIGVDIKPKRLRLARGLGATHVIDSRKGDVAARIRKITGGGVDYIVETTGLPEMHRLGVAILNPRGAMGMMLGETGRNLSEGRRTIGISEGDAVPKQFIPKLIRLHQAGRFPFDRLLKFYKFKDINRAMADSRRGDTIKPVLRIGKV